MMHFGLFPGLQPILLDELSHAGERERQRERREQLFNYIVNAIYYILTFLRLSFIQV